MEPWFKGIIPVYPEEGVHISAGLKNNITRELESTENSIMWNLNMKIHWLLKLHRFWRFSFDIRGEKNLLPAEHRTDRITTHVTGSYEMPGDYAATGRVELRFLHHAGLFVKTPRFLVSSFLFKFSPGFTIGYHGGITGIDDSDTLNLLHSGYISPLIAIRLNGNLLTVVRADIAIANSRSADLVFSINLGTVGNDNVFTPVMLEF